MKKQGEPHALGSRSLTGLVRWLSLGVVVGLAAVGVFRIALAAAAPVPDPTRWDVDVHPPIYVVHTPPPMARGHDLLNLEFHIACDLEALAQLRCSPDVTLWAAWGSDRFTSMPLEQVDRDSLTVWMASLPAQDAAGGPLRYYIEATHPALPTPVRYPPVGTLQPAVFDSFTSIRLGPSTSITPELVVNASWGTGANAFGLDEGPEQATVGPDALDVAVDGTIGVLDQVNRRVVLVGPNGSWSTFTAPLKGVGDIELDGPDVIVLDLVGEKAAGSRVRVPQLYWFSRDGSLRAEVPVFALQPRQLLPSGGVVDDASFAVVHPVQDLRSLSRDEQRAGRSLQSLRVQVISEQEVRLADLDAGVGFELTATEDRLGAVPEFTRWDRGYAVVFEQPRSFRLVWFDWTGLVTRDVSLPTESYSTFVPRARVAVTPLGDIYILDSTAEGVQVYRVSNHQGGES